MSRRAETGATGWTGWINNWTMWNNNGAPYGSPYAWGWWSMAVGLVVFAIGAALLRGSMFARTVAVLVATASLLSHFVSLNIAPVWSIMVITIDILVIWAVVLHGKDMKDV